MADLKTADLLALLKRHYIKPGAPLPGGIFLPEVGWNGVSGGGCDAIYVGFTSSSGRILVGHELKVSRADWLNELNKPGKADAWADQCHQWWLVVSDPSIVHEGELPEGWGLMSPGKSKTRMAVHVKANTKTDHTPSWTAVRSIMARQDTLRANAIRNAKNEAYQAASAEVEERVERRVNDELTRNSHNDKMVRTLQDRIRQIERALGRDFNWGDQKYGFSNQVTVGEVTVGEIEQIRQVLEETRSVKSAVSRLSRLYRRFPLDEMQNVINTLKPVLADIDEAVSAHQGAEHQRQPTLFGDAS
ncbi:gp61 [Mycobacterium phage Brujita]|uniref:Uncharacterized protein n=3 Tax=Caudoviricetes TaxID=2731619 RepID=A0A385DQJ3_9CAUD|nr:gp61 [Mycobacterium phage Brujita]YP_009956526.1 hypothetical protein I5H32_gp075 [Mycobacterium phage EleanorGeorge]ACI06275.1 hypothetical protein BRUJITA_61 [Mycobacterium phage Brujita]ADL71244.1 hypothetical protein ISLAND3_62 [Mycobacterium phage Island3]AXQ60775.1 hypothetical protein SEA_ELEANORGEORGE_75 [Mycobacterium phage EleanorGeorge]